MEKCGLQVVLLPGLDSKQPASRVFSPARDSTGTARAEHKRAISAGLWRGVELTDSAPRKPPDRDFGEQEDTAASESYPRQGEAENRETQASSEVVHPSQKDEEDHAPHARTLTATAMREPGEPRDPESYVSDSKSDQHNAKEPLHLATIQLSPAEAQMPSSFS